jgi:hypothetical protein
MTNETASPTNSTATTSTCPTAGELHTAILDQTLGAAEIERADTEGHDVGSAGQWSPRRQPQPLTPEPLTGITDPGRP